jgi:hypothetical protein
MVNTSIAVLVFQEERLRVPFVSLWPHSKKQKILSQKNNGQYLFADLCKNKKNFADNPGQLTGVWRERTVVPKGVQICVTTKRLKTFIMIIFIC